MTVRRWVPLAFFSIPNLPLDVGTLRARKSGDLPKITQKVSGEEASRITPSP